MSDMEQLIRPFQSVDVSPERLPPGSPVHIERVRLLIGIVGATQTFSGSASHTTTYFMSQQQKESFIK